MIFFFYLNQFSLFYLNQFHYHVRVNNNSINKHQTQVALFGVKASVDVWHARLLGHPCTSITRPVLNSFQLPVNGSLNLDYVGFSCQLGESKQLLFTTSERVSSSPLELVHLNVWVSLVTSNSGSQYYVIFINNYSRFTWMYPLINKSDVFYCFVNFKSLVENYFLLNQIIPN